MRVRIIRTTPALLLLGVMSGCQLIAGITDRSEGATASSSDALCTQDGECEKGELCLFGVCRHTCRRDGDCPAGARCLNTDDGAACISASQADCSHASCPGGTTCHEGQCRSQCVDRTGCADDQECSTANVCVGTDADHDPGTQAAPGSGGAPVSSGGNGASGGRGGSGGNAGMTTGGMGGITTGGTDGSGGTPLPDGGNAGGTGGSGGLPDASSTGGSTGMPDASSTGGSTGMPDAGQSTGMDAGGPRPALPDLPATCPEIKEGTITVLGQDVRIWVGPSGEPGPLVFYWHGTGSSPSEAVTGLGSAYDEITSGSGVIASFDTTTNTGNNTSNSVWYTGDFEMADIILACAADQGLVDTRRVYAAGCSSGGIQASVMAYERSSYVAASLPNSGGIVFTNYSLEDPAHVPAVMSTHGAQGTDVVVIDFSGTTATFDQDMLSLGAFVVDCDHGGGHCASPDVVKAAQWEFAKAHPFGTDPSPYATGLPPGFPSYCEIVQ